ncbi:MAG: hypothetical protein M3O46_13945, partial [Myxococcota bacterium]|nr:hypothetical protein [Myxococcota bacterium]
MSPRSPEEILKAIEDAESDDAVDRVLAMSPEERRRELEASGVDVNALHATADAFYARLHGEGHEEQPAHPRDRETRSADAGAAWEAKVPTVARRISPRWAALLAA